MTQLFEVSGLSLDTQVSILYGTVVPGASDETIAAPVGSLYLCTDGLTYKKLTEGSGADKWVTEFETGILSLNNVPATTPTVLDSLDGANVETAVWTVSVASVATPATRETIMVTGSHNGVTAKFSVYSRLQFGAKQANIYTVVYTGGFLQLTVAPEFVSNVECYRLTTVSHGTVQITGGSGAAAPLTNASPTTLGGVKVGSGLAIDGAGVLSVTSNGVTNLGATPDATTVALTSSSGSGTSIPAATTTVAGVLTAADKSKLDTLTVGGTYTLPQASDVTLGGVKVGTGLAISPEGLLSATGGGGDNTALIASLASEVTARTAADAALQASISAITVSASNASSVETALFNLAGVVAPMEGVSRWYPFKEALIRQAYFSVDAPSTTTNIVVRLRVNGVVLPNSDMVCMVGEFKSSTATFSSLLTPSDYVTMDVVSGDSAVTITALLVYNVAYTNDNSTALTSTIAATSTALGMVKVGDGLMITPTGVLSTTGAANASSVETVGFSISGLVAPLEGISRWYPPTNIGLVKAYFSLDVPSTTVDVVLQLRINGTVVPNSQMTCIAGAYKSNVVSIVAPALTPQEFITMDIVSGSTGVNIYAVLVYNVNQNFPNNTAIPPEFAATDTTLGMVKVGKGLSVDASGIVSTSSGIASVGTGLAVDLAGVLTATGGGGGTGSVSNAIIDPAWFTTNNITETKIGSSYVLTVDELTTAVVTTIPVSIVEGDNAISFYLNSVTPTYFTINLDFSASISLNSTTVIKVINNTQSLGELSVDGGTAFILNKEAFTLVRVASSDNLTITTLAQTFAGLAFAGEGVVFPDSANVGDSVYRTDTEFLHTYTPSNGWSRNHGYLGVYEADVNGAPPFDVLNSSGYGATYYDSLSGRMKINVRYSGWLDLPTFSLKPSEGYMQLGGPNNLGLAIRGTIRNGIHIGNAYSCTADFAPLLAADAYYQADVDIPQYVSLSLGSTVGSKKVYFNNNTSFKISDITVSTDAVGTAPLSLKVTILTNRSAVGSNNDQQTYANFEYTLKVWDEPTLGYASPMPVTLAPVTIGGNVVLYSGAFSIPQCSMTGTDTPMVNTVTGLPNETGILFPVDCQNYLWAGDVLLLEVVSGDAGYTNLTVNLGMSPINVYDPNY